MSEVTITYTNDNGNVDEYTVYNPEFVDTLVNTGEVAVDGRVFSDVVEVEYTDA